MKYKTQNSKLFLLFTLYSLLSIYSYLHAGWYSAEILSLEVGGRACGMGSAYTSISDDGFCAWWNPAGVMKNKGKWVAGMHSKLANLNKFNFISIGYPTKKLGGSISLASLLIDSIPEFPNTVVPNPVRFFSDNELACLLTVAYRGWRDIDVGVNIKYINYKLYNAQAFGYGTDLGIIYKRKRVLLGLTLKDIGGTKIKWSTNREDFRQMSLTSGMSFLYNNFIISVDMSYSYGLFFRIGAEYSLHNVLFLRIGSNEHFTCGAGVKIHNTSIDYAFINHELGNIHRISGSITIPH